MNDQSFKPGDTVYLLNGTECIFVAKTDVGYLVQKMLETDRGNIGDVPELVGMVYENPPVEYKHADIKQLDELILAKQKEVYDLTQAFKLAKEEQDAVSARVKEHEALKRIDAYLQGKFKYFVYLDSWQIKILPAEEALQYKGEYRIEGTKLLTLCGCDYDYPQYKKGRGFSWQLNQYPDGSGSYDEVYPVESEEEGKKLLQEIYDTVVLEWRKTGKVDYRLEDWSNSPLIEVPEDVKKYLSATRKKALEEQVESARARLEKAETELRSFNANVI